MKLLPVLATSLTLGIATLVPAQQPKPRVPADTKQPAEMKSSYEVVKGTKLFALGGIGIAATKCPAEIAFRKILTAPDAVPRFQNLLKEGTSEGRLYGLLGLKLLDGKAYAAAAPAFRDDLSPVESAGGCMLYKTTVAGIAKNIADGKLK